jgi:hypothetical protein
MYVRVVVYAVIRLHRSVYVRPCVRVCVCVRDALLLVVRFIFECMQCVCGVCIYFHVRRSSLSSDPFSVRFWRRLVCTMFDHCYLMIHTHPICLQIIVVIYACKSRTRAASGQGFGIRFGKNLVPTNFGKIRMNFGLNSVNFRNVKRKIHFEPHQNRRISPKFELIRSNPRKRYGPREISYRSNLPVICSPHLPHDVFVQFFPSAGAAHPHCLFAS